jgi:hypothetical protein
VGAAANNAKGNSQMAKALTELTPHIDEMRTKLAQTADHERSLTDALSDALKRMDQETLQNVRNISAEHEARRAGIMIELQALAASIGTLQPAREPVESAAQQQIDYGHQYTPPPTSGDWRQATRNVDGEFANLQDELTFHLNGKRSH